MFAPSFFFLQNDKKLKQKVGDHPPAPKVLFQDFKNYNLQFNKILWNIICLVTFSC
jgi:hypothetical protein